MKLFTCFLTLFVLICFSVQANSKILYPLLIGKTIDGKNFDLREKSGKIVIINFWATWCGYCKQEIAVLDQVHHNYKLRGLEIVEISIDEKQDYKKVLQHAEKRPHINLIIDNISHNDFGYPNGVPDTYVIDKKGKLVAAIDFNVKPINQRSFEEVLEPLFSPS